MSKKQVDAESAGEDSACERTPSNEPSEENSEGEETALSNSTMSQLSGEQESVPEETSLGESDGEGTGCDGEETPKEKCCVCASEVNVRRCGKCKATPYCSKACQKSHLDYHSAYCSAIVQCHKLQMDNLYKNLTTRQNQIDFKVKKKILKLVGEKPMLKCHLGGKEFKLLWDTGSMISMVDRKWLRKHFPTANIHSVSEFLERKLYVKAANSTVIHFDGVWLIEFSLGGGEADFWVPVLVASEEISEPILGYNVIEHLVLNGDKEQQQLLKLALSCEGRDVDVAPLTALIQGKAENPDFLSEIRAPKTVVVPAGHRMRLKCRVKVPANGESQTIYFSPTVKDEEDLTFNEAVSELKRGRTNYILVDALNLSKNDMKIEKGLVMGSVHSVSAVVPMMGLLNVKKPLVSVNSVQVDGSENEEVSEVEAEGAERKPDAKWDLSHLEPEQQEMLEKVLRDVEDVFSKSEADIGDIPDFKMSINLVDQVPVTAAYRRIPPNLYSEVKNYIDDLLNNGWIRQSYSSYSSPIVCVRKKDGSMRMCIDYRKLNEKTIADAQPIPRIQDILDTLGGKKWFSTLDMSKAYHQGYIGEEFRHLTAFSTPWTLMEWVRIPFGLRNAPPAFQRYVNLMLGDLKGSICEGYLDDILIYAKTFEEHVMNLKRVLQRLHSRGIKLRADKCVFAKQEVRYLGRLISGDGYRPDPADTEALQKFRAPPKNIGELRSLLGFVGYYRCYVQDFSRKVKPLYDLLGGDRKEEVKVGKKKVGTKLSQKYNSKESIDWLSEHQTILDELIDYLTSPNVIAYPDFDLPFFVNTDASKDGLGAVLYQTQESVDRVISYASRTLTPAERNYHMHSGKLEFLALKWAITEKFADYLRFGPPFRVFTDNNPLTYVLTTAKLNAVGLRWVNELADFDFSIKYRPGKENIDADYLSRRPLDITQLKRRCTESVDKQCIEAVIDNSRAATSEVTVNRVAVDQLDLKSGDPIETVSTDELRAKQQEDQVIKPVYTAVLSGVRPSKTEWREMSHESKILMKSYAKLFIQDGVLMRRTEKFLQIVLPSDFHKLVHVELHEKMGHVGSEKVCELARQRFYWPKMLSDIKHYIKNKCRCMVNKAPNTYEKAALVPIKAQYPFQMVSIDYTQMDKCKNGYQYALVVTDHFTRFMQVYATKSKSSKAAAEKIFKEYIMQFGFPERIHHDQGSEFMSKLFKELHKMAGIKMSNTTPYHPMGDGQVERCNRTLGNMLKSLSKEAKKDWHSHLTKMAFAFNSTVNKATGFTPFFLMFGRESRLPIDFVFGDVVRGKELKNKTHEQFAKEWKESMEEAMRVACVNIGKSADYNKKHYDQKATAVEMQVGDRVLVRNVREKCGKVKAKLKSYWEENIFVIIEKREGLPVYKIKNIKNSRDTRVVHRNLLLRCDELPTDVFDEDKGGKQSVAKEKKKTVSKQQQPSQKKQVQFDLSTRHPEVEEEDDEDDLVLLTYQPETSDLMEERSVAEEEIEVEGREQDRVEPEEVEAEEIEQNDEEQEDREQEGDEQPDAELEQVEQTEVDDGELEGESFEAGNTDEDIETVDDEMTVHSDDGSVSDLSETEDEASPVRRSSRQRRPTAFFSFPTIGGDPEMVTMDGNPFSRDRT